RSRSSLPARNHASSRDRRCSPMAGTVSYEVQSREFRVERFPSPFISHHCRLSTLDSRLSTFLSHHPLMDLGLSGKVALVTGGSKGIGAAISLELAREGANIAICAREAGALNATAERISSLGRRVVAVAANLALPAGVQSVVDGVLAELGRV